LTRSDESDLKDSVARLFTKRRDLIDSLISIISVAKSKGVSLADVSAQCEKMDSESNGYIPKFDFLDAFTRVGVKFKSDFERDFVDSVAEAQAGVLSGLTGKSSNIAYDSVIRAIEAEIRAEDEAEEVLDKLRRKIAREIKHPSELEDVSI
jgi:DNA-binding transcriptional MerR regulator